MSILDKFKKKGETPKPVQKKTEPVQVRDEVKKEVKKPQVQKQGKKADKKEFSQAAFLNLRHPLVTEKSSLLGASLNQYVFKVPAASSKSEIKKAIQEAYGVNVKKVNVINVPGKKRRVGRSLGFKSGYRKAIVFLPADEKIETTT